MSSFSHNLFHTNAMQNYEFGIELEKNDARAQRKQFNAPANSSSLSLLFIYPSVLTLSS